MDERWEEPTGIVVASLPSNFFHDAFPLLASLGLLVGRQTEMTTRPGHIIVIT